ncbi:MAG: succinylglutamate desuccinylase/aspartoacylase family protein [Alphaproteobacteria bacterium]
MSQQTSLIQSEIDYDRDGKQTGFLRLPYSVHRSAYGWIPVPIVMFKNGAGPTALMMSGNHGDEYEGQIALNKLSQSLAAGDIQGRLIILPMANYPAAHAGLRTSPFDAGNLNRSFPGDPQGTPTEMIAHYIEEILMPLCDYFFDLHSGGSSLRYPATVLRKRGDTAEQEAALEALQMSFDAPFGFIFGGGGSGGGDPRVSSAAAHRKGVLGLSTELGGSGTITPAVLALAERGVKRLLHHIGLLLAYEPDAARGMRGMELTGPEYFVYARDEGLFEPYVDLMAEVKKGDAAGAIHHPETPWVAPTICHFEHDGLVICERIPARVERGDCLFHLATDIGN